MDAHAAKRDLIAAEAAEWFVHLQGGDVTVQQREQFVAWLRQSAGHVQEYLALAEVWGDSRAVMDDYGEVQTLLAQAQASRDNVMALPWRRIGASGGEKSRVGWLSAAAALAVVIISAVVWFSVLHAGDRRYQTGIGEQLTLSLPDGSTVYLNAQSDVRIEFTDRGRNIDLRNGEARFHVVQDSARPFVVFIDGAAVQAIGTVFNIYRREAQTRVTVVEGKVAVHTDPQRHLALLPESAALRSTSATQLSAGEEAAIANGRLNKLTAPNIERVLAWTDQRLVFRSTPLREAVEEFNRYNDLPMRIDDPALAQLQISGTFRVRDPHSLLEYLQRHENVAVRPLADGALSLQGRN